MGFHGLPTNAKKWKSHKAQKSDFSQMKRSPKVYIWDGAAMERKFSHCKEKMIIFFTTTLKHLLV